MRPVVARIVASGGALAAAGAILTFPWHQPITQSVAASAIAASAGLLHWRQAAAQLFTRGLWTSIVVLAGMNAFVGPGRELGASLALLAGAGTALVAMRDRGLEEGKSAFAPVAFRAPLLAALALALADVMTLSFYGLAWLEYFGKPTIALGLAGLLAVGAAGLLALRGWGLVLSAAGSAAVAATALAGRLPVPSPVDAILVATSALQLALLAPVARAALRGAGRSGIAAGLAAPALEAIPERARIDVGAPGATLADAAADELEEELENRPLPGRHFTRIPPWAKRG
jgi:hypothetical protein